MEGISGRRKVAQVRETDLMADCYWHRAPSAIPRVARADRAGIAAFRCYGSTEHPTLSSARFDDPLAKRQFTDEKGGT
jgi:hypothetical protein